MYRNYERTVHNKHTLRFDTACNDHFNLLSNKLSYYNKDTIHSAYPSL